MTSGTLHLGAVSVDIDGHVAHGPNGEQTLSPLEARLLGYLTEHRGRTIPRERLLQEVWGYSPRSVSRAVDHTIARLRRKIEPDPAQPRWLISVRGSGYRLECGEQAPPHPVGPRQGLLGRASELAQLKAMMATDGPGLVTVHGPPGVGKTRLVREYIARATDHDTVFVGLVDARDENDLLQAVAAAVEVVAPPDARAWLGQVLHRRGPTVLVLDNAEQIHEVAATVVSDWRRAAPDLRILTTSRHPLGAPDESLVRIAPLHPPDAVALLLERARTVRWDFEPTDTELRQLTHLVSAHLDGLPLALELAGARLRVLEVHDLVERIADRFRLLRGGLGSAPWNSLEAALDWSWELLSEPEQRALRQCAVFRGGFDLAAAEAVLSTSDSLDRVTSLVDHALIQRPPEEPRRLRLLTSVRSFVERQGPDREAQARHLDWCASQIAPTLFELAGPQAADVFQRLVQEGPNLRAALDFALESERDDDAVLLVCAISETQARQGDRSMSLELLEQVLGRVSSGSTHWARARVLVALAMKESQRHDEALAVLQSTQPHAHTADARAQVELAFLNIYNDQGEVALAREASDRGLAHAKECQNLVLLGIGHQLRAHLEASRGSVEEAADHAAEAVRVARALGYAELEVASIAIQCTLASATDHHEEVLVLMDRAAELIQAHQVGAFDVLCQVRRGYALVALGRPGEGAAAARAAAEQAAREGHFERAYQTHMFQVLALLDDERVDEARAVLDELDAADVTAPLFAIGKRELRRAMVAAAEGDAASLDRWTAEGLDTLRAHPSGYSTDYMQLAVLRAGLLAERGEVAPIEELLVDVQGLMAERPPPRAEQVVRLVQANLLRARRQQLLHEAASLEAELEIETEALERVGTRFVTRLSRLSGVLPRQSRDTTR